MGKKEIVERYFHIRPLIAKHLRQPGGNIIASRGGATVRVVGELGGNQGVRVSYALCSANDAYCRKTGRETATNHKELWYNLNELPDALQKISREVTGRVLKLPHSKRAQHHLWNTDYSFAKKYFLAKDTASV